MRSLPHIVIACGTVWGGARLLDAMRVRDRAKEVAATGSGSSDGDPSHVPAVARTSHAIDYRLVALGSILPDLVERILRRAISRDTSGGNEHTLGHTLLLNSGILIAGVQLAAGRGDPRLLSVGIGALTHLLVDPVIRAPRTLFWPLLGFSFPHVRGLGTVATVVSQAAAGAIMLAVAQALARKGHLRQFLFTGRL